VSKVEDKIVQDGEDGDGFFTDLANSKPFLKLGLLGFAGAGKTRSMAELAIGLHKRIGSTKPIVSFDTEEAMQALKPLFDENGIKVLRRSSRSLSDLMETMRRCREGMSEILLIDSITHVWEGFISSYLQTKHKARLEFPDWSIVKPQWKKSFATPYVQDRYHIILTGRAGYEYTDERNDEGKREIYRSGVKMKAETETAFEPDFVVLMERHENMLSTPKEVWREGTVIKDRSGILDGKTIRNPRFSDFAPAIDQLLSAPAASAVSNADDSHLFASDGDQKQFAIRRDIAVEGIEGALTSAWPGSTAEAKRAKVDALQSAFNTRSWTEITRLKPEQLEDGLAKIEVLVAAARAEAPKGEQSK
jgi:hypothetical protein